jgi:hypothetical protein
MRFKEIISEKRRNAPQNAKVSAVEQLRKYAGDKEVFVSFTDDVGNATHAKGLTVGADSRHQSGVRSKGGMHNLRGSKLGINPKSKFNTPLGIYGYPIDYVLEKEGRMEFAANRPYIQVFRVVSKFLDLGAYTKADLSADIAKLKQGYGISDKFAADAWHNAKFKTPGGTIWNITRELAIQKASRDLEVWDEEPNPNDFDDNEEFEDAYGAWQQAQDNQKDVDEATPLKWSVIMRQLGYGAAVDYNGEGIIHENEKTQGVFFSIKAIKTLETINNTDPAEPMTDETIWIRKPPIMINQMSKGKISAEQIIAFMKENLFMFGNIPFEKFPKEVQQYILNNPNEFTRNEFKGYAMANVPFPPSAQIKIIQDDPRMILALPKPVSSKVMKYVADNYEMFSKEAPEIVRKFPNAKIIDLIRKDPAAITHLPGSPSMVHPSVLDAIIDIDPSLFARYWQSYDAGKIAAPVIAKFYKKVVVPQQNYSKRYLRTLGDMAAKFPPATILACFNTLTKRDQILFLKAFDITAKDGIHSHYTRQTGKPPSMLTNYILSKHPELKSNGPDAKKPAK